MDKNIIIDGVNISGCVYYNPQNDTGKWCDLTCERDDAPAFRCEQIKNCVYKQMKRLEQKNTKLKDTLKKIKENIEPCLVGENCSTCNFDFCANKDILKIIDEVLKDE